LDDGTKYGVYGIFSISRLHLGGGIPPNLNYPHPKSWPKLNIIYYLLCCCKISQLVVWISDRAEL